MFILYDSTNKINKEISYSYEDGKNVVLTANSYIRMPNVNNELDDLLYWDFDYLTQYFRRKPTYISKIKNVNVVYKIIFLLLKNDKIIK